MCAEQLRNVPPELAILDGAEVFVLVDNVSDALSSVPDDVTSEFDNLMEAGAESFSGDGFCFACFGISLIVTGKPLEARIFWRATIGLSASMIPDVVFPFKFNALNSYTGIFSYRPQVSFYNAYA